MLEAALHGVLAGTLIASVFLYVRGKFRKARRWNNGCGTGVGFDEGADRPICSYSTHDPMGSAIIRVGRTKH